VNTVHLIKNFLPPLVPVVTVALVLEVVVRQDLLPSFLVPAPSSVLSAVIVGAPELWHATMDTAIASVIGFGLSVILGVILAIALSSASWVERAFYPYAVFFQTVPIIAIAPLLVIWFGWDRTVVASAFIVSIFPVIANTLSGLHSTEPALRDVFKLYDAGAVATLLKLRLPFALPHILTGLKIAAGLAVIGAIVGEFITGAGIGGAIMVSRQQNRVDKVFGGLLLASLLGIILFWLINLLTWLVLRRWHASAIER